MRSPAARPIFPSSRGRLVYTGRPPTPDEAAHPKGEPIPALLLMLRGDVAQAEDSVGSLEPGKLADLAILDTDILACDPQAIRDTRVTATVVGGVLRHQA